MENGAPAERRCRLISCLPRVGARSSATDLGQPSPPPPAGGPCWNIWQITHASCRQGCRPEQPLLIGARSTRQASCLYVPATISRGNCPDRAVIGDSGRAGPEANRSSRCRAPRRPANSRASVSAALDAFAQGRLRQVVLSRAIDPCISPPTKQVMSRLMAQNPHAFHFSLPLGQGRLLARASPSCCCGWRGEVFTHPLAGSARRASEPAQDEMVAGICWLLARISMNTSW